MEAFDAARLTDNGCVRTGTAYVAQQLATGAPQDMSDEDIIANALKHCEWLDSGESLLDSVQWAIAEHGSSLCYHIDNMITCLDDEDEKSVHVLWWATKSCESLRSMLTCTSKRSSTFERTKKRWN
ncbi:hypothetical protein [Methanosarcina horonobensis]|uniref:hypothetical protein n=1 Tax=Methanosarcina horonobensis TaxID=418008 RepID=UPI0022B92098|nr:hypothetical protein [Methanosarcina horonobensis]